ncbi:MAG: nucleotide pyrophosphohydrolase [Rubrivivax sp.]|nr:nucleotide pyrophosphohydrolase [Rubrivivax sp.]
MAEDLRSLTLALREFARARDWDQFHAPKNLAMALTVEAAELMEHFQWLDGPQSEQLSEAQREAVALEAADVLLYLLRLADRLGIDLGAVAARKLAINESRYPVEKARGKHLKHDQL